MATAGDGRAPCESGGAGEKFRKRLFQPDVYEEPQNVPREEGRNNPTGASELNTHQGGISEVKQMLKQMTLTLTGGVAESWVKRHVFSQFSEHTGIHGFTSHNEFIVLQDGYIVLYDSFANKETILEKFCFGSHKIVEYVDTLVWVAPDMHEMVDGAGQN